jgi:hypothetical protein
MGSDPGCDTGTKQKRLNEANSVTQSLHHSHQGLYIMYVYINIYTYMKVYVCVRSDYVIVSIERTTKHLKECLPRFVILIVP